MTSRSRFFSGALREAIEIRDRERVEEMCDEPWWHCDVDHVEPWPEGETSEENGELRCGHHNRKKGRARGERRRDGPAPPDDGGG